MPSQAVGWTLTVVCAAGQHPLLRGDLCELKEEKASGTSEVEVVEKTKPVGCENQVRTASIPTEG